MNLSKTLRAGIALVLATSAIACGDATELVDGAAPNTGDDTCVDCGDEEPNGFTPGLDDGDNDTSTCAVVEAGFAQVKPTVVLLVDQSGSMTNEYADGVSRWDALYGALMSPTDGVVSALQDDVQFGLALYTSFDGFDGGECPVMSEVGASFGSFDAIDAVYASAQPEEDTPTGAAIVKVADALSAQETDGPKIIIVATDGEPDTCAEPDPQNGQQETIDAAAYAYGKGIRTFVLGVGRDVSSEHLQDVANAGAGLAVDGELVERFFQPETREDLLADFGDIIDGQRSCVLPLDGELDLDNVVGEVTIDGEVVDMGDNGWKVRDARHIELVGDACETVMSGNHEVAGTFMCNAVELADSPR